MQQLSECKTINEIFKLISYLHETVNDWATEPNAADTALRITEIITGCETDETRANIIPTEKGAIDAATMQRYLHLRDWEKSYTAMIAYLTARDQIKTIAYMTAIWEYITPFLLSM